MSFTSEDCYTSGAFLRYYNTLTINEADKQRMVCKLLDITPQKLRKYLDPEAFPPEILVRLLFLESTGAKAKIIAHLNNEASFYYGAYKCSDRLVKQLGERIKSLEREIDLLKHSQQNSKYIAANSDHYIFNY